MPKFVKCLIVFVTLHMSYGKIYEECRGINKPNTVVPSTKSCSKYIFCNGANSYEGECLAGNYFNPVEGNCDDPENVICNIEPSDDVKSIYDEDFKLDKSEIQDNTGENMDEGGDTGDEGEDVEDGDDNGDEGDGDDGEGDDNDGDDNDGDDNDGGNEVSTENNTHMEKEDNKQIPAHNVATIIQHHQQPGKCPQAYGLQSFKNIPNPESCVSFFTCYNGMAIPMLCPAKMYFNELSGKCETQMPHSCKVSSKLTLKFFRSY